MKRIRYAALAAAVILAPSELFSQNLNPDVVVTNQYQGKAVDAGKENIQASVPDSVLTFDWDFAYSVFDSPYKGAYEFSPYGIAVSREASPSQSKRLFLKGGAGYTFHPELYVSYDPWSGGAFHAGVQDDFKGYSGQYVGFGEKFHGYDYSNSLGIDCRLDGKSNILDLGLGYDFIAAGDTLQDRVFHCFDASVRLVSNKGPYCRYRYSMGAFVKFDTDRTGEDVLPFGTTVGCDLAMDYKLDMKNAIGVSLDAESAMGETSSPVLFNLIPKYVLALEKTRFDLGLKLSLLTGMGKSDFLFPDLSMRHMFFKDKLYATLSVSGGNSLISRPELVSSYHHLVSPESMMSSEGIRVNGGVDGRLFGSLQYQASAGYVHYSRGLLAGVGSVESGMDILYNEAYDELYTSASVSWVGSKLDASESVKLSYFNGIDGLGPSPVTSSGHIDYIFSRRFRAGADMETASARKGFTSGGDAVRVPGWVDLDLRAEYSLTGKMALWVKAGNLLCQKVYRTAFYAEPSFNLMAGICLNIR